MFLVPAYGNPLALSEEGKAAFQPSMNSEIRSHLRARDKGNNIKVMYALNDGALFVRHHLHPETAA